MANINLEIAKLICATQIASDSGKGLYSFNHITEKFSIEEKEIPLFEKSWNAGYRIKTQLILSVLKLIRSNKTKWSYKLVQDYDQNGVKSKIVYFRFKNRKYDEQISFHFFAHKGFEKMLYSGDLTIEYTRKDSRESAFKIYSYLLKKEGIKQICE